MDVLTSLVEFSIALAIISIGGMRLCQAADRIARSSGLGGTWVGLTLLAIITSLPELSTGISAVALTQSADLAVGVVLGSCVFNLMIFAILDMHMPRDSLYAQLGSWQLRSAAFSLVLLAIVAFYLLAPGYAPDLEIAGAGLSTLLIVGVYCMCMQSIYQSERCRRAEKPEPITGSAFRMPISWDLVQVAVAGSLVVAAGIWLPFVGERIALALSVDETFVGTILIAFTTSAPELVVAIAAIRIGAPNMAVGNLLGSNLFNLLILAPEDLLYRAGPLLQNISPQHVFSVISAMLMTVITMIAIARRSPDSKVRRIGLASGLLIGLYLINSFLIYSHQG